MLRNTASVIILLCLFAAPAASACVNPQLSERDYTLLGVVKNIDGDLIYEEHHNHKADKRGGISEVEYKSTNGETIAKKILDYDCRASAPNYILTMNDDETLFEKVEWRSDMLVVTKPDGTEVLDVIDTDNLVIDAGFDNFVYENWSELTMGIEKEIDFLHVKGNDLYRLLIKLDTYNPDIGVSSDVVLFEINAKNRLFRLFSEPIYLGYNKQTKKINYYAGPSNLRGDVAGLEKSRQVTINYIYN